MRIKLFFLISSFNLIVPYICLPFLSAVERLPSSTDKISELRTPTPIIVSINFVSSSIGDDV